MNRDRQASGLVWLVALLILASGLRLLWLLGELGRALDAPRPDPRFSTPMLRAPVEREREIFRPWAPRTFSQLSGFG